jgi:hypothetical protein
MLLGYGHPGSIVLSGYDAEMQHGGARVRSGPPADPNALKREFDRREWTRLPKSGCTLDVPEWPIEFGEQTIEEEIVWNRLWHTPQAIVWHNDGVKDLVVVYTRTLLQAASRQAAATTLTAFRQYGDQLLLSTPALRAMRYFIEGGPEEIFMIQDPDGPPIAPTNTEVDGASNVRDMFHVVKPEDDEDEENDGSNPPVDEE